MGSIRHILIKTIVFVYIGTVGLVGQGAVANEQPVADAGMPRYAAKDSVQLDGRNSYDPDESGPLTYAWTQVSGPPLTIALADTAKPTIRGFVQTQEMQTATFELTVTDGELTGTPARVEVIIVPTFTSCTMALENAAFDPNKPTVLYFHGGTSEQTGGGRLNRPLWTERANIISFPSYVGDPGTFSGAQTEKSYRRPGDMIIVYLSAVAPDYHQPIQTLGWSIGGLLALDVARQLNLTYGDARYTVNHACLLDPSAWVMGTAEFHRRVAELLDNPVAGEQCWVSSLEAANASVCPSALNIVFTADHALPYNWYLNSVAWMDDTAFDHGVLAGAYWSVVGPGRNLQLASTPGVQTYKFRWVGFATEGHMELYDESNHPGRLPEPVTLGAWASLDSSGDIEGVVLSCHQSENAVGYELLVGPDPLRVMDFQVISETPLPPVDAVQDLPPEDVWWTIRVRDQQGSTIHADPMWLDAASLPPLPVENARTGRRFGFIEQAMLEAQAGDEIVLDAGIYEESVEFGGKPVTVRSLDPNDPTVVAATIIIGRGHEPTVTFSGEGEGGVLAGLTIQSETLGISCQDAVPTIRNCVVQCADGIALEFWYGHVPTLVDCSILGRMTEAGLVAHWAFDETEGSIIHDSEGGHDAVATAGTLLWRPGEGAVDGALELNGATSAVADCPLNPADGPFSILAWVKGGAPGQVVISQQGGVNWLMAEAATGSLSTELAKSVRSGSQMSSQAVISDGDWHLIGFIWDGFNRRLYVDEVLVAEDVQEKMAASQGKLVIGAGKRLPPDGFWSGLIDDMRIYNQAVKP